MRKAGASRWLWMVYLFFAATGPARAADGNSALATENARLKSELQKRGAEIRSLTESLAIARTEVELFQEQWAEARLRAQTMGADFADAEATRAQRRLADSVRLLYLADAERQRLMEQLRRLVTAVEKSGDVSGEIARAKEVLASCRPAGSEARLERRKAPGALTSARVLDVNPPLKLVVLDVGAEQGVRVGMPFSVAREGREVARLRIVEARRNISGALMEKMEDNVTVTAGDAAQVTNE